MTRHGMAHIVGLALLLAGCADAEHEEAPPTADALLTSTVALYQDLHSTLDQVGAQMERLDERHLGADGTVAETWSETRSELWAYREGLESKLARLEGVGGGEALKLKREMAEDLEHLTARLERADLEAVEDERAFLAVAQDRMARLEEDLRVLDEEAAFLSGEAREEASRMLDALRDRAARVETRLDALCNAEAEEIASRRTDIAHALGALTASVRRELFEWRQVATD